MRAAVKKQRGDDASKRSGGGRRGGRGCGRSEIGGGRSGGSGRSGGTSGRRSASNRSKRGSGGADQFLRRLFRLSRGFAEHPRRPALEERRALLQIGGVTEGIVRSRHIGDSASLVFGRGVQAPMTDLQSQRQYTGRERDALKRLVKGGNHGGARLTIR
eukprot:5484441-Prymnesium_polylepis.2